MPRIHGKDIATVNVDDAAGTPRALRNDTRAVNFEVSSATHDTTTMGDQWVEVTAGLRGGDEFTHELMYDNAAAPASWALYTGRLGVEATFTISDGTRTISMETVVTKLSIPFSVADMVMFTATHRITGAVTFS